MIVRRKIQTLAKLNDLRENAGQNLSNENPPESILNVFLRFVPVC